MLAHCFTAKWMTTVLAMSTTFGYAHTIFVPLPHIKLGKWKSALPCTRARLIPTVNRKNQASLFISIHFAISCTVNFFHTLCMCVCVRFILVLFEGEYIKTSAKFTTSCVNTCRSYAGRWHMQIGVEKASWKALGFLHTGWLVRDRASRQKTNASLP